MRNANRPMLPWVWNEARQLLLRRSCGLRQSISGPVWNRSSEELKGSQVSPETNALLVLSLLEGSWNYYLLDESLKVVSHQRGSAVIGDSGTTSAHRIGENMTSSRFTNPIKDGPFFHGAKAEFPKFRRDFITFVKQHGLFRVFTEKVEISVVDKDKSVEEVQATYFAKEEIRKYFLTWNILS